MLNAHSELKIELHDLFATGHKVAVRLEWTGIRTDDGEAYHKEGVVILHLDNNGRIAERWSGYT